LTGDAATVRACRETDLAARVLDALLREDYGGLSGRVSGEEGLALPGGRVAKFQLSVRVRDHQPAVGHEADVRHRTDRRGHGWRIGPRQNGRHIRVPRRRR
jgi:hypothetical protein